jgi:hypothetical protein
MLPAKSGDFLRREDLATIYHLYVLPLIWRKPPPRSQQAPRPAGMRAHALAMPALELQILKNSTRGQGVQVMT